MRQAVEQLHPSSQATTLSLDRVIAYLNPATQPVQQPVAVNLDPPRIFNSTTPAILVIFMGEPQLKPVETNRTDLLFALNTNWDVLYDSASRQYYLLNGEGWLTTGPKESPQSIKADLHVVKMQGWRHDMLFDETGLLWLSPSPNITSLTTALIYPGTCLLEATNLSEGRGTNLPFEKIGAPWLASQKLIDKLQNRVPGVYLRPIDFIPMDIPGKAKNPKFKGTGCRGLQIDVTAPRTLLVIPDTPTKRREYEEEVVRVFYLSNADLKETMDLLRLVLDTRRVSPVTSQTR